MTRLIYGLPSVISSSSNLVFPGVERYSHVFKLYGNWVMPVDRTGTITIPVKNVSLFPIPAYKPLHKSYEDICNGRAVEILKNADELGIAIYVMYSGGIDSTCLLVSLLKHATPEQKKNIVVLLSHESIAENPRFYEEHIKGALRVGSSITFPQLIGGNDMLLSAEHNDLVMGSDKIGALMVRYGPAIIHQSYNRSVLSEFFVSSLDGNALIADFYLDLFERIRDAAPVPIRTNMEFLWWANFSIKWQACFYYILLFTNSRNVHRVNQQYIDTHFISFYNTVEFQLWSMNNLDKRIKDTWKSYKWIAKDIIYEYTKDAEYRDHKTKRGSLLPLLGYNAPQRFIDDTMHFSTDLPPESYLEPENDFV